MRDKQSSGDEMNKYPKKSGDNNDRKRTYDKKKSFDDRGSYNKKPQRSGEFGSNENSRGKKKEWGTGDKRTEPSNKRPDRKNFSERPDAKRYENKGSEGYGAKRTESDSSRPERKKFGDRPSGNRYENNGSEGNGAKRTESDSSRPERKKFGDRPGGNRYENKRSEGFGAKRTEWDNGRPERKKFGDRPSGNRYEDKRSEGFEGKRPESDSSRPERKKFGDRPGGNRYENKRSEGYGAKRTESDSSRPERKKFGDRPSGNRYEDKRSEGFEGKRPESNNRRPERKSFDVDGGENQFESESNQDHGEKKINDGYKKYLRKKDEGTRPEENTESEQLQEQKRSDYGNETEDSIPAEKFKIDDKPRRGRSEDSFSKNSGGFDSRKRSYERGRNEDRKPATQEDNIERIKIKRKKVEPIDNEDGDIDLQQEPKNEKPWLEKEESSRKIIKIKSRSNPYNSSKKSISSNFSEEDGPREKKEAEMPLNKYIAHCGECSRREAAELVKQGKVKVNDELVIDPGHKVQEGDKITLSGKKMMIQKGHVYILLNKPKGYITTVDDPQGRPTVLDLVSNSGEKRLYPIGRLDRNTTGLLLLTNDGDLTQRLSHPTFEIKKVYQVTLDRPLTKDDFDKIMEGIDLEDGKAIIDQMAYLEEKNEVGLEIHSGKNRIVRRVFESLNYKVEKLDRVMYAGLTKKNLPRKKWRYLDEKEIIFLKHFKK